MSQSIETITSPNPLSTFQAFDCETIIDGSTIDGDCCALNTTQSGGCVLNVEGGRCIVSRNIKNVGLL